MKYSVIVPLKNEAANIVPLIAEIEGVMDSLKEPWELILINDGSVDGTEALIKQLTRTKSFIRLISFDKNYGQSSAFDAGFKKAVGEFVITLDGDGQNDPHDIPRLLDALPEAHMVVGWRVNRKDTLGKRLISKLSNTIRSKLCHDNIHDTGCSLKIYRRSALEKIKLFHGLHRFLPALFIIEGFTVAEVQVSHRPRASGVSNYHFFNRSLGPFIDLFAVVWMYKRRLSYRIKEEI